MSNPLLTRQELPPFDQIQPEHVVPAIEAIIADNLSRLDEIAQGNSYDEVVLPLEVIEDVLSQAVSPVSHMNAVVSNDELRDAYNQLHVLYTDYGMKLGQHQGLNKALKRVRAADDFAALSDAQKRVVNNALRDFALAGVDLPEDKREAFTAASKKLAEVTNQFSDNVMDATDAWSKQILDDGMLQGLPANSLAMLRQTAEQRGQEGYLLTLDFPSYHAVMTYCDDRDLRREVYEAYATRASDTGPLAGQFDNSELVVEILNLRRERAELLGFATFADYSLAAKMAPDTNAVIGFLNQLAEESLPAARREFADLASYARQTDNLAELQPWDVNYYSEKQKSQLFDISDEILRPYFPAATVINGLFEIVNRLFDITIEQSTDIATWHDDVMTYNILRKDKVIARFYFDLYARAKKRGGAWMDECRVRRVLDDGRTQLPVAYLTCNFAPPVGDKPSLLTHNEVVTLFHEFGHGIHHMLTQVDCAGVSGINGVAWDAVELPSQFMENWCWQPESLPLISAHYETGEPLPEELLQRLLKAKNYQSGMMMVRQLEFALFDFRLHTEFDGDPSVVQRILAEVRDQVAVVKAPSFHRFQNAFGHIFGSSLGYAAGYYSYKWAEVLSADAFSRFLQDGVFNRQTGEQFLETVLEKGGSVDAMDLFVAFMGREPSIDALLRQEGIRMTSADKGTQPA